MPRPLVILLHGTRFNARSWDGYADLVDADLRAVDLPGHGVRAGTLDQLAIDTRRYARACQDPRIVVVRSATHLLPFTHRRQLAEVINEASGVVTAVA